MIIYPDICSFCMYVLLCCCHCCHLNVEPICSAVQLSRSASKNESSGKSWGFLRRGSRYPSSSPWSPNTSQASLRIYIIYIYRIGHPKSSPEGQHHHLMLTQHTHIHLDIHTYTWTYTRTHIHYTHTQTYTHTLRGSLVFLGCMHQVYMHHNGQIYRQLQ